jgi:lipopolysaccharide transport system ATP-binding protein
MNPVICVEDLSKRYFVDHQRQNARYQTLRESLAGMVTAPLYCWRQGPTRSREEFWALQDVNFEVQAGDVVGVIGRNGAGKSTLLKIVSRITKPTRGRVTLEGRVGSLLEVGTGFHPELTGRENIYLNGSILGMSRREIGKKFDEIVDFAEIEKFLDTPVKRYSSGMYVRLAFSVAAHLEPEILIIDEVLAVGDAAFQQKCIDKMRRVAHNGRTVLFVTHHMATVLKLCTKAVQLTQGKVVAAGLATEIVKNYLAEGLSKQEPIADLSRRRREADLHGRAKILSCEFHGHDSSLPWASEFGEGIGFTLTVEVSSLLDFLEFGFGLFTSTGFEIASAISTDSLPPGEVGPGRYRCELWIDGLRLMPGQYFFGFGIRSGSGMEDYVPEAVHFDVLPTEVSARMNTGTRRCSVVPASRARIEELPEDSVISGIIANSVGS